ncbi:MAG: YetF domain-containing protein [Gaiellaceae bacterium]
MDIVLRAALAFAFLVLLFRVLGRRELSSFEPFDLILLIVIGDLIQQGVTQSDYSLTGILLSVGTFAVLTVALSFLTSRVPWVRPVVEAAPIVVVQDGKVLEQNLRRERMTAEEVAAEARQRQIRSLDEVEWAVLEGNGRLSFITKR